MHNPILDSSKHYVESKIGLIPKDWEIVRLGEIGEFKNGINKDKNDFGKGFPFINLMDVFGKTEIKKDDFGLVDVNQNELNAYS